MTLTHATDADLERMRHNTWCDICNLLTKPKSASQRRSLKRLRESMTEIITEQNKRKSELEDLPW